MNDLVLNVAEYYDGPVWIGLSEANPNKGDFLWVTGGTLVASGYTNWASGEPDESDLVYHCVVSDPNSAGDWFSVPCGGSSNYPKYPFIIEYQCYQDNCYAKASPKPNACHFERASCSSQ